MTFGSLFTGIGGLDRGLEAAGLRPIWQVEHHPYRLAVLNQEWPGVPKHDDVTTFARRIHDCEPETEEGEVWCPRCEEDFGDCCCIGTDQIIDEWGVPDLICGGDPCQENSNARRSGGLTQASLGGEFIRIVEQIRPRLVLRENPSVMRKDAPWPWWRFRDELERLGYAVLPFRLRACCVGADHRRERLFLLAELQDADGPRLEGNVGSEVARAIDGGQHADTSRPDRRRATPRVCRGSDGIPDRKHRLESIGNAVDVGVAEWIGRQLIECDR